MRIARGIGGGRGIASRVEGAIRASRRGATGPLTNQGENNRNRIVRLKTTLIKEYSISPL